MPIYFGNQKVAPSGVSKVYYGNDLKYQRELGPLCFTGAQDNSTVKYTTVGTLSGFNIQTSSDGENWNNWDINTDITLNNGDKIYVRNTTNVLSSGSSGYFKFVMSGKINSDGNLNSLINYGELYAYCYNYLFINCTSLITPPSLPAMTLADYCYINMFYGCTGLTSAPALPAETLANYCYSSMFYGCTGLTSAPALPAMTLADYCYINMFEGCTGLTSAPALPAETLEDWCYYEMFYGCTGLTSAPALPAETLANYCYYSMFRDCTGLTSAPALPATTLANNCYQQMFQDCTSLKVRNSSATGATLFFTCPSGITPSSYCNYMFYRTGGSFTGTPVAGESYYWYTE